jgi:DNA-binding IscR family transcriptional regulator
MRFQEIRKMAKDVGISTHRMKKTDIVRAIQGAEDNVECYGTERVDICQEPSCLWRSDCLTLNNGKPNQK